MYAFLNWNYSTSSFLCRNSQSATQIFLKHHPFYAIIYNMNSLDNIRDKLTPIFQKHHAKRAIIFGSYAKGTNTPHSDVDLYVDSQLHGLQFVGFTEDIREALDDQDVDIFDATHVQSGSPLDREIHSTGIVIYG